MIMSTTRLSDEQTARARKNYSAILQRLASIGNLPVAIAMGKDESTVSRWKPEKYEEISQILAAMDLKIVPSQMRCFNERDIETILHQAKRYMEHIQGVDQLEFD